MNRKHPTTGNNLFGGRQRVYIISDGRQSRRQLYDADVVASTSQKWAIAKASKGKSDKISRPCESCSQCGHRKEPPPIIAEGDQSLSNRSTKNLSSPGLHHGLEHSNIVYNGNIPSQVTVDTGTTGTIMVPKNDTDQSPVSTIAAPGGIQGERPEYSSSISRTIQTASEVPAEKLTPSNLSLHRIAKNTHFPIRKPRQYNELEFAQRQKQLHRQRQATC